MSQLDVELVLDRVLENAREITGARYAALGILDRDRRELERFVTRGIDPGQHAAIGDLPRGRGILGVLIDDPRPLRIRNVGDHPKSYGFPPGHPPMASFLGVPVVVRGQAWGNLYLTEKGGGGEFDAVDEESVTILATWAAIAIENARLYEASAARRDQLEHAARRLEAAHTIAVAVGAEMELENVLALIAKRGRALVQARSLVILLRDGADLVVAASAGVTDHAVGVRVPIAGSTSGQVLESRTMLRLDDVGAQLRISADQLGVADAHTALLAPLVHRGLGLGVLAAFDHGEAVGRLLRGRRGHAAGLRRQRRDGGRPRADGRARTAAHTRSTQPKPSAAGGLASSTTRRSRGSGAYASSSRRHCASVAGETVAGLLGEAVDRVDREIENLRAIITELRPAALDELGLSPAIEALLVRLRAVEGLSITATLELPADGRLGQELETTVYRLVQEALTNVAKHARADHADVSVTTVGARLEVVICDDGAGFDPAAATSGFGLAGMRERVELSRGRLAITPTASGTTVRAVIPLSELDEAVVERVAD